MKRKLFILFLLLQFLIGSTGLPLTIEYCTMNNSASEDMMCSMCKSEVKNIQHPSQKQNGETQLKPVCCVFHTVDFSIKDKFVAEKTEITNKVNFSFISPIEIPNNDLSGLAFVYSIKDKSPPGQFGNQLYLNNSAFLI